MQPMLLMLMHVGALGCSFVLHQSNVWVGEAESVLCISLNFHFTRCELLVRPSCCSTAGVPDVLKDLLLFILLIKGVVCNLQTARAGIIFSISSALLLIPLWGLFSGANPPAQPGDRCTCHHGDTVARETHVSERSRSQGGMGCPEADEAQRWRLLDLLSQLNVFHFFYFIISDSTVLSVQALSHKNHSKDKFLFLGEAAAFDKFKSVCVDGCMKADDGFLLWLSWLTIFNYLKQKNPEGMNVKRSAESQKTLNCTCSSATHSSISPVFSVSKAMLLCISCF